VADDVRDWFDGKRVLTAYVPFVQAPDANISFVMRTNGTPSRFAGSARAAISHADSNVPAFDVESMRDRIAGETSGVRNAATRW